MGTAPGNILDLCMNGTTPFLSHRDALDQRLSEARALLLLLESAFRTANDARNIVEVDTIDNLNPVIVADAIEGIATLLALAQFHEDERGR